MKKILFVVLMLVGLCAGAQQPSQQQSNDRPIQPQSDTQKREEQPATQPQAELNAPSGKSGPPETSVAADKNAIRGKEPAKPAMAAPTAVSGTTKGCLAVKPIGSHAFRNIMLGGVAGALISRQQYQVVDAVNYPVSIGTKFHGDDLQTITSSGSKVVIMDKHYKKEDLEKACH